MSQRIELQLDDLLARQWRFRRGDGSVIADDLRLEAGGSIKNHFHENERSWSVSDGCLAFHNSDGAVTTRFTNATRTPLGLVLSGEFPPSKSSAPITVHILEELNLRRILADGMRQELFGQSRDSYDLDKVAILSAAISSSQYVRNKMVGARRFSGTLELLDFAVSQVALKGLHLEFGVYSGRSLNHLAQRLPNQQWFGFDSFEGLPDDWRPGFPKGSFARTAPAVRPNVELVVGWFENSLNKFLGAHPNAAVAFLHIDCDLYSSTSTIFNGLGTRIKSGTIIVFDEYFNYPGWEIGEFLAFKQFVELNNLKYEYVGFVPSHQQVAVRVL
jgi:hypothetical protein